MDTPGLVEGCEHIALYYLIAYETQIAEQLVVMGLTISQTLLLVVSVSQKWFFTFGADEVLDVPVLAQCCHYTFLNGSMTGTANRNSHFVVTSKTVQLFFDGSGVRIQFYATVLAIEMVGMVWFALIF
jgi:hypothetical protein